MHHESFIKMRDKIICVNTGMFLIRLGLGLVFVVHGWSKLAHMQETISFFATLGFPAFVAYLVALVEFLGGLAMITGVCTKWAGFGIAIVMVGAVYSMRASGFSGGYEFPLTLLLTSLGVAFTGPGTATIHSLAKK